MAFHFSLEAVLRLRHSQERAERLKLEAILSEQSRVRTNLEEVIDRSNQLRREFLQQLGIGLTGSELEMEALREANVKSVCNALRARILDLEQLRVKQLQVFVKIRQSREILENLRLRKLNLFRLEQGRREQQSLDDLFLMRQENEKEEENVPGR